MRGAWDCAADIVRRGGVRQLWKGNSAVLVRVLPFAGIHYAAYEQFNALLAPGETPPLPNHPLRSTLTEIYLCHTCSCHGILRMPHHPAAAAVAAAESESSGALPAKKRLSPLRKFASGAGAGATSTLLTYHLRVIIIMLRTLDWLGFTYVLRYRYGYS
eukprot:COSAG01_NODE_18511_length_1071_cov_1.246914_1_plen_159_part_00